MSQSQSLLDFLYGLIRDGGLRAEFTADPAAVFAQHGIADATPQSIYEALVLIGDNQDLGRNTDILHIPPPPPPAYFADHDAHGAGVGYLDNYVSSSFDDDRGPFTGSSDAHGIDSDAQDAAAPGYDDGHGLDGLGHGDAEGGLDGDFGADQV